MWLLDTWFCLLVGTVLSDAVAAFQDWFDKYGPACCVCIVACSNLVCSLSLLRLYLPA